MSEIHDYPNGDYWHRACRECAHQFSGPKREFLCRLCRTAAEDDAEKEAISACQGMNCGRRDGTHSLECEAEYAAALAGGYFLTVAEVRHLIEAPTGTLEYAARDIVRARLLKLMKGRAKP